MHVNKDAGTTTNTKGANNKRGRKPLKIKSQEKADFFPELPAGFSNINRQEITSSSSKDANNTTPDDDEAFQYYYDASCDIMATIEYLRFGRGKNNNNKLSIKEATDLYQTAIDTAKSSSNYGGCISRCPLLKPGRPWTPLSSSSFLLLNRNDEWCVVGLGRDFLYNDTDSESAMTCLLETLSGNNELCIVGFFADLDYSTEMLSRPGCDRESQLRRLSCTCHAAGEANVAIQIRASPGVVVVSSSASVGGEDTDSDYCSYVSVMGDLVQILTETTAQNPLLKVHLSCWSGGADRMMSLLQAFPQNLYFGFDASVSFSKASHIHECAFDIPLSKVVLETGANTIPSVMARCMGRDAFSHSGLVPFVAAALAAIKGNGITAEHVACTATQNTLKLYPQLLVATKKINASDS